MRGVFWHRLLLCCAVGREARYTGECVYITIPCIVWVCTFGIVGSSAAARLPLREMVPQLGVGQRNGVGL